MILCHFQGQQGACGGFLKNTGATVALGFANYESGKHCGRKVTITYGGVTREAEVRDACEACQWGDIDLTPSLFQAFAHHDQGIFAATWWFSDEKAPTSDPPASSKPPAPSSKPASQPAAQPQPSTTRPQSSQQQSQQPAPSNSGASQQGSNSQGHSDAASVTSTGLAPSSTDKCVISACHRLLLTYCSQGLRLLCFVRRLCRVHLASHSVKECHNVCLCIWRYDDDCHFVYERARRYSDYRSWQGQRGQR